MKTMKQVNAWCAGEWEREREFIDWMQSRPDSIQDLMRDFPPSCVVKAKVPLNVPAPNEYGIVISYLENGTVSVISDPDSTLRAICEPSDLELVKCWKTISREFVSRVLKEH